MLAYDAQPYQPDYTAPPPPPRIEETSIDIGYLTCFKFPYFRKFWDILWNLFVYLKNCAVLLFSIFCIWDVKLNMSYSLLSAGEGGPSLAPLWIYTILAFWLLLRLSIIYWKPSMMNMLLQMPVELHFVEQLLLL